MDFKDNRQIVLLGGGGEKFVIRPGQGMKQVSGLGVVDTDRFSAVRPGSTTTIAGKNFVLLDASLLDILGCMRRGAQIILPKDSAHIILGCCIGPGNSVLEVGTGSGGLTLVLAHAVGDSGRIVSYESNPKHAKVARANIELGGTAARVELREADAGTCTESGVYDAAVIDMPEPWTILDAITEALKPGSYVCAYLPTMNQAERVIKAMRERDYSETHVLENIQRELVVGDGGTRPSFDMLGHTGYLCFGRKVRV